MGAEIPPYATAATDERSNIVRASRWRWWAEYV
jgi:hypothetical protein